MNNSTLPNVFHGRGWLDRDCNFLPITEMRENHQDILNELGYRDNEHALKFGFIRIGLFSLSIGYVEFKGKLSQKQFETIWFYMITNRPKKIMFNSTEVSLNDFLECNKVDQFMRLVR